MAGLSKACAWEGEAAITPPVSAAAAVRAMAIRESMILSSLVGDEALPEGKGVIMDGRMQDRV
jgi:hypothetical protein